jgi:hypothetical protein
MYQAQTVVFLVAAPAAAVAAAVYADAPERQTQVATLRCQ